jgi:hypothetical protein
MQITLRLSIEQLKAELFGHNPPHKTAILHRREIIRRERPFECLWDEETNQRWEKEIRLIADFGWQLYRHGGNISCVDPGK